jgi:hypothetical protein
MRRVYNKPFRDWPQSLQDKLRRASFGNGGGMCPTVDSDLDTDTFVMLDAGEFIGWGLVNRSGIAMFYTLEKYRQQGVAKIIGERIKKKYMHNETVHLHMYPHDKASDALEVSLFREQLKEI